MMLAFGVVGGVIVVAIIVLAWSLCACAGQADRAMARMYRR
jgi:hypothetical protein